MNALRCTRYFIVILILQLCKSFVPQLVAADTLTVSPTGQIRSISTALSLARKGDVILVTGGIYLEGNISIDKTVTLTGVDFPTVDAGGTAEGFLVNADSVVIHGFHIRNVTTSHLKDKAGIRIDKRSHCLIEDNRLAGTFFGIYLKNARNCIIRRNEVTGVARDEATSGNAIHLWYSDNILIEDNICRFHRDGIYLEFVGNSRITGNLSENNIRYGLHFMFSNQDVYEQNTFRQNGAGVAVMFSRNISMNNNLFERNLGSSSYGLLLKDILDGEIRNNTFRENTIGIYADGSNRILYEHNDFVANGWAIKILGSCMDNIITRNNFTGNTFDVMTNSQMNMNTFKGNYWSGYAGYDLDRDGVGDVPYKPVKLFSYIVGKVPGTILLLRSFFVELVNFAEQITPVITPPTLEDPSPRMKMIAQ